jgi:cobalt-zinc-cadmium efflux system membrane fusion protein
MNMNNLVDLDSMVESLHSLLMPVRKLKTCEVFPSTPLRFGTMWLFALLSLSFSPVNHAENDIKITQEHFNNLGVTLGKLQAASQIPLLTAPAKVVVPPEHEYIVSASQAGLITKLNAAIGDKVKKGEILAELNSPDLLSMQRLYLKALSELQLSAVFYQRDKKLLQEGVIADRRWQETQAQYQAFLSEANEHKQLLQIAGMSNADIDHLSKTHQLTSQLSLHSPITGVIMERMTVAGERIGSLAPIYRVANLDELWLEINIPQERVGSLNIGDSVQIENTDIHATIRLLGQSVNQENQTVLARAVIKGKPSAIRTGQRINIQIIQSSNEPIFKVPNTAIAQNEGKSFIFVRNKEGFVATPVTVIGKQGDDSFISSELSTTSDIATQGAGALKANWLGLGSEE